MIRKTTVTVLGLICGSITGMLTFTLGGLVIRGVFSKIPCCGLLPVGPETQAGIILGGIIGVIYFYRKFVKSSS